MLKAHFIAFIFLCGNQWVSAQEREIAQKEQDLVKIYSQLRNSRYGDFDSLMYYSELFSSELQNLLSSDPGTFQYSFKRFNDESICNVKTSKDGLFRIYSWDNQTGGTMHSFNAIYQYKQGDNTSIKQCQLEEDDAGCFYSEIFTLKVKKKTLYLGIANGIYSTKDMEQSIKAFELTPNGVNDSIPLMKTPDGLKNSLAVYYDFFSVIDRPERPVGLIKYNEKKKRISVAETNEKDEVTSEQKIYQFNGRYFEERIIKSKK